jgi:hypothetical protein
LRTAGGFFFLPAAETRPRVPARPSGVTFFLTGSFSMVIPAFFANRVYAFYPPDILIYSFV